MLTLAALTLLAAAHAETADDRVDGAGCAFDEPMEERGFYIDETGILLAMDGRGDDVIAGREVVITLDTGAEDITDQGYILELEDGLFYLRLDEVDPTTLSGKSWTITVECAESGSIILDIDGMVE